MTVFIKWHHCIVHTNRLKWTIQDWIKSYLYLKSEYHCPTTMTGIERARDICLCFGCREFGWYGSRGLLSNIMTSYHWPLWSYSLAYFFLATALLISSWASAKWWDFRRKYMRILDVISCHWVDIHSSIIMTTELSCCFEYSLELRRIYCRCTSLAPRLRGRQQALPLCTVVAKGIGN